MLKKILRIIYNIILVFLGMLIFVVGATLIPIPGNYKMYVVQSGSMEPAIKTGSLIFVKPASSYGIGDIVTIKDGKNTVTHRIIAVDGDKFTTKGDANEEADNKIISRSQLLGKMLFTLPWLGYPVGYAKTKVGFVFLVLVPAIIIIYDELHRIKREAAKVWQKKKEEKAESVFENIRIEEKHYRPDYYAPPASAAPSPPRQNYPPPPKRKIV